MELATSMAGSWWFPAVVAVLAVAVSTHLYRSVRRDLTRPDGSVRRFCFREVTGVVLPLFAALPALYLPSLYGWLFDKPLSLSPVGTAVAWVLVIAGAIGMVAANTRRD